MVRYRAPKHNMSTRQLAKKALRAAGRTEIYFVNVANTVVNMGETTEQKWNLMANFATSTTEQGLGKYSGNKIFLKNIEWDMHLNADKVSHAAFAAAEAQAIKPLVITFVIVETYFDNPNNTTFPASAIFDSVVSVALGKYTPSTSLLWLGKYRVLHRETIKMAGIIESEQEVLVDTIHKGALNFCGKIGLGQYVSKGSIKINKTIKFDSSNNPSQGLKCFLISENTVLSSTLWEVDGASLFKLWYTDD